MDTLNLFRKIARTKLNAQKAIYQYIYTDLSRQITLPNSDAIPIVMSIVIETIGK
mgnify:CR=1 FL=1